MRSAIGAANRALQARANLAHEDQAVQIPLISSACGAAIMSRCAPRRTRILTSAIAVSRGRELGRLLVLRFPDLRSAAMCRRLERPCPPADRPVGMAPKRREFAACLCAEAQSPGARGDRDGCPGRAKQPRDSMVEMEIQTGANGLEDNQPEVFPRGHFSSTLFQPQILPKPYRRRRRIARILFARLSPGASASQRCRSSRAVSLSARGPRTHPAPQGSGSGFIVHTPDVRSSTNSHVVHGASKRDFRWGTAAGSPPSSPGMTPHTDLAVIRHGRS